MKKIIIGILLALFISLPAFAETIVLKSGDTVETEIIERTDEYIKVDVYGIPLTYYLEDIETIDGQTVETVSVPEEALPESDMSVDMPLEEEQPQEIQVPVGVVSQGYQHTDTAQYQTEYGQEALDNMGRKWGSVALVLSLQVILIILLTFSMWLTFQKAGHPGWACLIPIYNFYILIQMAKRPVWWLALLFVPLVNAIIQIVIYIDVARNFGRGVGFGLGLSFLPFIFFPIIAFNDSIQFAAEPSLS